MPETYGQLYTWEVLEARVATTDGGRTGREAGTVPGSDSFAPKGTHPGEGLWVLTIQALLYRFLALAVQAILRSAVSEETGIEENSNGAKMNGVQKDGPWVCS